MTEKLNPVARLGELPLEPFEHGEHYESLDADISDRLELTQLGAALYIVPPGKSAYPFHNHHAEDEMFVILEGEGTYRFGPDSHAVQAGDVLGAPRGGPAHAHKLTNTGSIPLKYVAISSKADTEICEYPDSGKFLATTRLPGKRARMFRYVGRQESEVDYWDGEDSAD
jgi:uncharacterized cupin superfamily protein